MKPLLILTLLLIPLVQAQEPGTNGSALHADDSPVLIVSSKWTRDRQPVENAVSASALVAPQPAITASTRNFERQKRVNQLPGERDPNADTLDTRGNELERINQQARQAEVQNVDGFAYQVKVQNGTDKITQHVFWEYRFREADNPSNQTRRQFVCSAKIKPAQAKSLEAFSRLGPSEVVDVKSLGKKLEYETAVVINRVEFSDGTFWQRKGWDVAQARLNEKARAITKNLPSCRSF